MNLGLFGGGFKPFTTGHFSKVALAMQENDKVILFYAAAARTKGSDFAYTKEMAQEIFEITKGALDREYGDKLIVLSGKPTPIVRIFETIAAVKDGVDKPLAKLSLLGIDPNSVKSITVYGDSETSATFVDNVIGKFTKKGEDKEAKYYGDLYKDGKLKFDTGLTETGGIDRMISAMKTCGYEENLEDLIAIRGSQVRTDALKCDWDRVNSFLPNVLDDDEKAKIINILSRGINITSEGILRTFIREVM